jgi:hypothetical protein
MRLTLRKMALAVLLLQAMGCSIKATLNQTTDTTSNMTGTTSSARSWFTEDGLIRPEFQAVAFVSVNQANLLQDLAVGQGEYLGSVSRLLGVPDDRQPGFFSAVQRRHAEADSGAWETPHRVLATLRETAHPFLR